MKQTKLSDWETARCDERGDPRRPCLTHVQILCAIYQTGPEDLGLVTWRTPHEREQADKQERERLRAQIRAELDADADRSAQVTPAARRQLVQAERARVWAVVRAALEAARQMQAADDAGPEAEPDADAYGGGVPDDEEAPPALQALAGSGGAACPE